MTDAPGYVELHRRGELARRAAELERLLDPCRLCPRLCGARRGHGELGVCGVGAKAQVARACRHRGEEPPLSGTAGAGTIFFGGCNLGCVYCQNHQISHLGAGDPTTAEALAEMMLDLQRRRCHNLELVTPSHVVPQIVAALELAAGRGLRLPVVYNTSAYERRTVVQALEGVVDVYLPDLKYGRDDIATALSGAPGYVARSRAATLEMARQVGTLQLNAAGLARRGLIVRHLVLPGDRSSTSEVLGFVARELGPRTRVSLMAQYRPPPGLDLPEPLTRPLYREEYEHAVALLEELGLDEGWVQDLESVDSYVPDFDHPLHPFEGDGAI
ncbi:MAG: radical SAM protein [bacterium]